MYAGTTAKSPGKTFEAQVLIDGVPQPLFRRGWDGKIFVIGAPGAVYRLRVHNLTHRRIEVINSVDGRHTQKDEPGDLRNRGLVFGANAPGEFAGWRVDNNRVRDFVFGIPEHGIAAQAGDTSNIGVIGFAAYCEQDAWKGGGVYRDASFGGDGLESTFMGPSDASFAARGPVMRGGLGTGAGEVRENRVGRTTFVRAAGDPDVVAIGYDTEDYLRQQGIIAPQEPDPFPGIDTGYGGYRSMTSL